MSEFDAFGSAPSTDSAADPAADFLAKEEAELAKIENNEFVSVATPANDPFEQFESENKIADPFEMDKLECANEEIKEELENNDVYSSFGNADVFQKEPEKITRWREEQKLRLTTKDTEEEQKKSEWKELAKKELDDWYKNRQEQLTKTIANNKEQNKATEAELAALREKADSDAEWDRISKLCDFNPKANKNSKDVSRMRSILLQLKQTPLVR
jgi:clathrin light chain A